MSPGKMIPWVSTTEAVAAPATPAHEAAAQVMVSPTTSTSPAKATSGVTTMPLRRSLSGSPFVTTSGGEPPPPEQGLEPPVPVLELVDVVVEVVVLVVV